MKISLHSHTILGIQNVNYQAMVMKLNIATAQHSSSPKEIIASFQTADRIATLNKNINKAFLDKVYVKKFFVN